MARETSDPGHGNSGGSERAAFFQAQARRLERRIKVERTRIEHDVGDAPAEPLLRTRTATIAALYAANVKQAVRLEVARREQNVRIEVPLLHHQTHLLAVLVVLVELDLITK